MINKHILHFLFFSFIYESCLLFIKIVYKYKFRDDMEMIPSINIKLSSSISFVLEYRQSVFSFMYIRHRLPTSERTLVRARALCYGRLV